MFLVAACGALKGSEPVLPTLDVKAVAQVAAEGITVKFYGEECEVSSPSVVPEGEYLFIFKDLEGKSSADLYVAGLTEGHTFQDLLDIQGEPGRYWHKPNWVIYDKKVDVEFDIAAGEKRIIYSLEKGEHAIYIGNVLPPARNGLWFCVPLIVVEAPSE
jgi:hypothetical protein